MCYFKHEFALVIRVDERVDFKMSIFFQDWFQFGMLLGVLVGGSILVIQESGNGWPWRELA